IDPAPKTPCPPPPGCTEYDKWVAKKILDVDLDKPPGAAAVTVVDEKGKPIPGAHVHLAGPLPLDAPATDGVAKFDDIVPGSYSATANAEGFLAADGPVAVPEGGTGSATLTLKSVRFDLDVLVEDKE